MPVSALVLTTDGSSTEQLRANLLTDPRIAVGDLQGHYLPVVTDTRTVREARELGEDFLKIPGVIDAQLVSWTDESAIKESEHGA